MVTTINCGLYGERFPRIWTELRGNSSYKPPGVSYAAQGPQKQPNSLEKGFLLYSLISLFLDLDSGFQTFGAGSRKEISRRIRI